MPTPDLFPTLAQSGAAGLIAWMWLTERRSAAARDRQLSELADRLTHERTTTATLLSVIGDNTRALGAIEIGQRSVASILDRLVAAVLRPEGARTLPMVRPSPAASSPVQAP
jgi:hypothetical protein